MKKYTQGEESAIQQFTGMHYSGGTDVKAVCRGMGLDATEWENIKEDCEWLDDVSIKEIEEYLKETYL